MANSCKYYTDKMLAWMLNNKLIVFLSLLSFCLFVSTWALAAQKNRALSRIDDLNAQLATTTTLAPAPNTEQPGTGETGGNGETGGEGETEGNSETEENAATTESGENIESGGTGDNGTVIKLNAAIDENEVADQEKEKGDVNSNDHFENVENNSDLQSIVQNSKLLTALAV